MIAGTVPTKGTAKLSRRLCSARTDAVLQATTITARPQGIDRPARGGQHRGPHAPGALLAVGKVGGVGEVDELDAGQPASGQVAGRAALRCRNPEREPGRRPREPQRRSGGLPAEELVKGIIRLAGPFRPDAALLSGRDLEAEPGTEVGPRLFHDLLVDRLVAVPVGAGAVEAAVQAALAGPRRRRRTSTRGTPRPCRPALYRNDGTSASAPP